MHRESEIKLDIMFILIQKNKKPAPNTFIGNISAAKTNNDVRKIKSKVFQLEFKKFTKLPKTLGMAIKPNELKNTVNAKHGNGNHLNSG